MAFDYFIGIAGAVLVLIAFLLSSMKRLSRGSYAYMFINGLGGFALAYYAIATGAVVFAVLNIVWGGVEVYYFVKKAVLKEDLK